jgi:hypothetical protein
MTIDDVSQLMRARLQEYIGGPVTPQALFVMERELLAVLPEIMPARTAIEIVRSSENNLVVQMIIPREALIAATEAQEAERRDDPDRVPK